MNLALVSLGVLAVLHPASVSRTIVSAEPGLVSVDLRFQTLSLLEALPELDANRDGRFSKAELEAGRDTVGNYLLAHWRVLEPPFQPGDALAGSLRSLAFASDLADLDQAYQWVDARLELVGAGDLEDLVVHSELFGERDPYHRDFMTWRYGDEAPWEVLFSAQEHRWHFRAGPLRAPGVRSKFFSQALAEGEWRIGLALFVLALALSAPAVHGVAVGLLLLFAGSGIAFSWSHLVHPPPARFVHLATPLALAYIGAENLMRRRARIPWIEAPLFGALVTWTIITAQGEELEFEPLWMSAHLGLAAALVLLALAAALLSYTLARAIPGPRLPAPGDRPGMAARWLHLTLSALTAAIGLGAFAYRTGWMP